MSRLRLESPLIASLTRRVPYVVALIAAVVVGVLVGRSANPLPFLAVGIAVSVGLVALVTDRLPALAFVSVAILTLLLPDVFDNAGVRAIWVVLIAASVAPLVLYLGRAGQPAWADLGIVLLAVGFAVPPLVSSNLVVLVANAVLVVGVYLAGRIGAPSSGLVRWTLCGVGAIQAIVAILVAIPATAGLVPFSPEIGGIPYEPSRSTGLYNNPNGFGVVEAMIIAFLLWSGPTRRTAPVIVLCAVGLLMSGSREAIIGLLLATVLLSARSPGRVTLAVGVLAVVMGGFVLLVPGAAERFDPSGYGSDSSLLERFTFWQNALALIGRSPLYGYGTDLTGGSVDQAYLTWLLTGGIIGAAASLCGVIVLLLAIRPWPVMVVIMSAGLLASSFTGPTLALMLLVAGAMPRVALVERLAGSLDDIPSRDRGEPLTRLPA